MALRSVDKGFTLLESLVVLFIFVTAVVIVTQIYLTLTAAALQAQNLQLALDSLRFGAEKIWNEVKSGSEFNFTSNSLEFKNRRCRFLRLSTPRSFPFFDPEFISFRNFNIYYDKPSQISGSYYNTENKIILFSYDVLLKTKRGDIPFSFWQTVAPLNSILLNPPCQ